ncbi:MAG: type II toxin-antitoxin system VapC family toxin [Paludibacterium sp.]|uniref:type II toxin-antitoxin system VapC family toxin n=1 Tax=Paludibacterium sp. TaxID=1917523 RepID=UPI0025F30D27|nr:type II toxin-antitoxin system VapC family toxin [Paludibacterium sp.]MBV8049350.1 type II toxin-antitoxin system VapC family toxin [Paludibacterium sp.]MBV8649475.1 type II toxin-antitoxin system VapC family toxin [Paludibacterium sp.]
MRHQFMLDTNTVRYLLMDKTSAIRRRLTTTPAGQLCITAITYGELAYAVANLPDEPKLRGAVQEFLLRIDVLPWDGAVAAQYGMVRAALERNGPSPLGNLDIMIAAHALTAGTVLITSDPAFRRVAQLQIEDWSESYHGA